MSGFPVIDGKCVNCKRKFHEGNWHYGCTAVTLNKSTIIMVTSCGFYPVIPVGYWDREEAFWKLARPDSEIVIEITSSGSIRSEPFCKLFSRSFRPWGSNIVYVDFERKDRE